MAIMNYVFFQHFQIHSKEKKKKKISFYTNDLIVSTF
jgi:hypothetical protein